MAHYMPWYVAKPTSEVWGWHWTMNHFNPENVIDGRREIASHFHTVIGLYDSSDPSVIEYHLLLMKLAGIDGVIVDWYGLSDFRDYAVLQKNTQAIVDQVRRLGMKLIICYEDQTITALVDAGKLPAADRVSHAKRELSWLQEHWFALDCYVRIDEKPVLLSFGNAGLTNVEWSECLSEFPVPLAYFSEHTRRDAAVGGFDWPIPSEGLAAVNRFQEPARNWKHAIPVVYPRFVDIYAEAGLHASYGTIQDSEGRTLRETLRQVVTNQPSIIQIATWNDWGEGTQIEPSVEFGTRDLEIIQKFRRITFDKQFSTQPADLSLPLKLYQLRSVKKEVRSPDEQLDKIAILIAAGNIAAARERLNKISIAD